MHYVRASSILLLCLALLVAMLPLAPAGQAQAPDVYHGTIHYRVRGPGALPVGIGSALLVGGVGMPIALVRVANMLRTATSVIARLPSVQDSPGMRTVHEWAHEGIPIDLARVLPVAGAYEARLDFSLERSRDGTYHLQSGTLRWTASNDLQLSDGDVTISDRFRDSGSRTLDPTADQITLRLSPRANPPTYELDIDVRHPSALVGKSEVILGPLGPVMTLDAAGGRIVWGGLGTGFMGADDRDMGPASDSGFAYLHRAPLEDLRGVEVWRDLLDNMVVVEYNLYSTLRADAGGPYRYEMGQRLALDGSASQGAITDWTWTFAPGPGCADGPPPHGDAEKLGERATVVLLCDTRITLTVEDAQGNRDTDEVLATRTERDWETTFRGPLSREEADSEEGRMAPNDPVTHILARSAGSGQNRTWEVEAVAGINVNGRDSNPSHPDHLEPQGSGTPRSWDDQGYTIVQVDDAGGPFDAMYYLDNYDIGIQRRTLINPYLLPASAGGVAPMRGVALFYDRNREAGHDIDGYLEAIREHEYQHGVEMRKAIEAHDPAPDLDGMYHADRGSLREQADQAIDEARLEVCVATMDPLPGGSTSYLLTFPRDDASGWELMEIGVNAYEPLSRAEREGHCR